MSHSNTYFSRDLSWMNFNQRVLDQAKKKERTVLDRLKFLAITASNLDEFFMIRAGSLHDYIEYGRERIDYTGLREHEFKTKLYAKVKTFVNRQQEVYDSELKFLFKKNHFDISTVESLSDTETVEVENYFKNTIFPILTPMVYHEDYPIPMLKGNRVTFGVVAQNPNKDASKYKVTFVQVPKNLPQFYVIERDFETVFVPLCEIVRTFIHSLFRNISIESVNLFRITRNADFSLEESDDTDEAFLEIVKKKIDQRNKGRVVRLQHEPKFDSWLLSILRKQFQLDDDHFFPLKNMADYASLWEIVTCKKLKHLHAKKNKPLISHQLRENKGDSIFKRLHRGDILLHHPYNTIDPLIDLLESSAEDAHVLSIKITIYRLAKKSRIANALLRAAMNGKNVTILFEVKARFDEANNIKEGRRLQQAGCNVIFGIGNYKTHTKLLLIVRKKKSKVTRYVHMATGNYNETTSKLYTDIGLLSSNEVYANDVTDFFNSITGYSIPESYQSIITAPKNMRTAMLSLINTERENAKKGLACGIVIKINSLQDRTIIDALYAASNAGVKIKLIIRGICCLNPQKVGQSENIEVKSIIGDFLEHSRIFYFHNEGEPVMLSGSADLMVRSFDRRIESLFKVFDPICRKQLLAILEANINDTENSYQLTSDGESVPVEVRQKLNIHQSLFEEKNQISENERLMFFEPTL